MNLTIDAYQNMAIKPVVFKMYDSLNIIGKY